MFMTKDQFEKSKLYRDYEMFPVEVLEDGYHTYATAQEDGIAVAIQVDGEGNITTLRAAAEDAQLTTGQKRRIFEFACDFIFGSGAADRGKLEPFTKAIAKHLASGSQHNTFLLGGANVGLLPNSEGGLRGVECQTSQSDDWDPEIKS